MIGLTLVVLLAAVGPRVGPEPADGQPPLSIEPCVGADVAIVGALLDIELSSSAAPGAAAPQSITVRCLDDGEEIRVEPWASSGADGTRTIQLPPFEPADPAARDGRSRELALAIAELIRRLQTTRPLSPPEPPPPPPPLPVVVAPAPAAPGPPGPWHLGVLSATEYFGGGELLLGGDVSFGRLLGRWVTVEVTAGARAGAEPSSTVGRLSERSATGSAAVGLLVRRRWAGFGLSLRARGFLVQLRDDFPDGGGQTIVRGAAVLGAEPSFSVAVTPHVSIQVTAGVGSALHGILLRQNGVPTTSLTGVFASGSVGAIVGF